MKTFIFNEEEAKIIQLALELLINSIDGKNDISVPLVNTLANRLREYSEEVFASIHSQGG